MYKEWAEGQTNKIKGILNAARADHTEAVKSRIENVQQLGSVVEITKTLFEVSKVGDAPRLCRVSLIIIRKPPNSKPKHTSSSKPLHSLLKPSQFSILGFDMRDK